MLVKDYISKNIQDYPGLFKDYTYEKSKLKVLGHIFFVNGNGLEIVEGEGYVSENCYDDNSNVIPYGTETYEPLPEKYFNTPIFKRHDNNIGGMIPEERMIYEAKSNWPFTPDVICKNSIISKIYNGNILKDDWMEESIILCTEALEYYFDESRYKYNIYYINNKDSWNIFREGEVNFLKNYLDKFDT